MKCVLEILATAPWVGLIAWGVGFTIKSLCDIVSALRQGK